MAKPKKRSVVRLAGTAMTNSKVRVELQITDAKYEVSILKDDIHNKRVWREALPDDKGWMKLLYSADGPTGDPWPIGKVRIFLDLSEFDPYFGELSNLTVEVAN